MPAITVTATPLVEVGGIGVQVSGTNPAAQVTIVRRDVNGSQAIRLYEGQSSSSGSLYSVDHEHALTGAVRYTATSTNVSDGYTAGVAQVDVTGLYPDARLSVPLQPNLGLVVRPPLSWSGRRLSRTVHHEVIGRRDDVANLQRAGLRQGSFDLFAATLEEAAAIEARLTGGWVVMLRQVAPSRLDLYFAVEDVALEPAPEVTPTRRWVVRVGFREVRRPSGKVSGALGWTVAAVAEEYATVAELADAFATVGDLTIGPPF